MLERAREEISESARRLTDDDEVAGSRADSGSARA